MATAPISTVSSLGRLLRQWRQVRGLSQLELALATGISSKHLSFVETGRAQPGRDVVLRLASALDLPLRDAMLLATQRVGFFVGEQRYVEERQKALAILAGQPEAGKPS